MGVRNPTGIVAAAALTAYGGLLAAALWAETAPSGLGLPRLSIAAMQADLAVCDADLRPPAALLRPASVRKKRAMSCRNRARLALATAPTNGRAHYVAALAAFHAGDTGELLNRLAASRKAAANEGWLAERRFVLAAQAGGPATRARDAEIPVLLSTQSGAELLAQAYIRFPPARSAIARAAREAPPAQQRRLANLLKRMGSP